METRTKKRSPLYVAEKPSPRLYLAPATFTKSLFGAVRTQKQPEAPVPLYLNVKR
jgi:hypothetical protein